MSGLIERVRTRIPSFPEFLRHAAADPRRIAYDLLPITATPRSRDFVRKSIARVKPRTEGFSPPREASAINELLKESGLAMGLPRVPPAIVAEIRDYFERTLCIDPYRPHLGKFLHDAVPSPEINMGYFSAQDIVAAPHVLALFNDAVVLAAMELYLGCKPMIDNIGCWWSFGGRPAAKGTQRYHRDLDSFGGAKLFIYLTDVDEESGPHVFVKGSHRSPLLATGKAQCDHTVRDAFGRQNETVISGIAGSRFVADTFGYHKGLLPRNTDRLLLTAQYTVNRTPHLPRKPVCDTLPKGMDAYINHLLIGDLGRPLR